MFTFETPRPRRRPSLTPMIDVVFLLLVFFMLAARFGQDFSTPLSTAGGSADYAGPPRLITLSGTGMALNGQPLSMDAIAARLPALMTDASDLIFVQPTRDASLQQLVDVIDALRAAGLTHISVVAGQ